MNTKKIKLRTDRKETMVKIPLSALRCIVRYPKEKKAICEINLSHIKGKDMGETLDEIINGARLDYALGNYTTHTSAKSLIAELKT